MACWVCRERGGACWICIERGRGLLGIERGGLVGYVERGEGLVGVHIGGGRGKVAVLSKSVLKDREKARW